MFVRFVFGCTVATKSIWTLTIGHIFDNVIYLKMYIMVTLPEGPISYC